MAENTNIEWAKHTFNPWIGCQKIGPGCDHCYAETWDEKSGGERWGPHAERTRTVKGNWDRVVTWDRKAAAAGTRDAVFVASLADVCDTHKSIKPEWRADLAALVRKCPSLDFMFLTKRAGNIEKVIGGMFPDGAPDNLWVGITVVNQEEANRDILKLLQAKTTCGFGVAFLSMEPLLGAVDLENVEFMDEDAEIRMNTLTAEAWVDNSDSAAAYANNADGVEKIDWVIVGGETGAGARPMRQDWVRNLRDQCDRSGTPFLFKQWGDWGPEPGNGDELVLLGKKETGRLLDGRTWDGLPARDRIAEDVPAHE